MSYRSGPYRHPEHYGLQTVGEIDWDNEHYQFNLTVIWRHKDTGALYLADDSGCSCPSPFERLENDDVQEVLASLERVPDVDALRNALTSRNSRKGVGRLEYIRCQLDISEILGRLHALGVK